MPMLKKIAVIMVLLAFSLQTFSRSLNWVEYWANTEAFVKSCLNKNKPKLACHGKCQIMKKMAEQEKKESRYPGNKSTDKDEVLSSRHFFCCLTHLTVLSKQNWPPYSFSLPLAAAFDIFQPPGF
jgi:hypothetical protein